MKYEYWFANIKGISGKRKCEIRNAAGTAERIYYMEETGNNSNILTESEKNKVKESKQQWKLNERYQELEKKKIRIVFSWEDTYPNRLRFLADAPYALYVKGKLPEEEKMTAAIVGARECSPYGKTMANEFAKALAGAGIQIISGMARGVDSAGQWGAITCEGKSFGVMGCGLDICYPREAIELFFQLQEHGGVISEFPPGTPPLRQNFPARNRIISGLADIVLVIEAKEQSGSLITADMALEQGKEVYALPGNVTSKLSMGCNRLIKQGAAVLLSPQDLLEELHLSYANQMKNICQEKILLETTEDMVYSCLDFTPRNLRELMERTNLSVAEILDVLVKMELRGIVKEISKNYYVKVK